MYSTIQRMDDDVNQNAVGADLSGTPPIYRPSRHMSRCPHLIVNPHNPAPPVQLSRPAHDAPDMHDPGVSRPPNRGISVSGSLSGSVSIARVLTLLVPCCSPLQECFPQKSGYCERDRRAKILSSPRTSPGS